MTTTAATTRCVADRHDVVEMCRLHGCPFCRRDLEPYVVDPDEGPALPVDLEQLHAEHVDPVTGECALCAELIDQDYVRRYPGVLCEREGCAGCARCGREPEAPDYEPTAREQTASEREADALRLAMRRRRAHLVELGLRTLQRVPCRFVPGAHCVSCGPDIDLLLDLVDRHPLEDR